MYTSKATEILKNLQNHHIVEDTATIDLLTRKNMGGYIGQALDAALADAKELVEQLSALVRQFDDLHADLGCTTPEMVIPPISFTEFSEEEMKKVHQYNALIEMGVEDNLNPYELDKIFVLIEQLGL